VSDPHPNVSCTTNGLAPIAQLIDKNFTIEERVDDDDTLLYKRSKPS